MITNKEIILGKIRVNIQINFFSTKNDYCDKLVNEVPLGSSCPYHSPKKALIIEDNLVNECNLI